MNPAPAVISWRDAARARPAAVALGNFDGVHLGHRRILEALRDSAAAAGLEPVALTFEPHPRQFLAPGASTSLLTAPREKEALIRALGVDVVTLAFDADLAALPAEDFVSEVLVKRLRGARFFLGADHRFGKGARGDAALLRSLTGGSDSVTEVSPEYEAGEIVSSSAIRHHLKSGRIARANAMLGGLYRLRGTVARGAGRGRGLGFPTANVKPEDHRKILPFGVFGGRAAVIEGHDGAFVSAVANIGMRPTFAGGDPEPAVEVHILGGGGDLYGRVLEFEFHDFIRPEKRFENVEALKSQIAEDVEKWRKAGI